MIPKLFNPVYSDQYDKLYADKDYASEIALIETAFARFSRDQKTVSILDLGCGTGNFAIPLTRKGYQVTGVDISENMLSLARIKALGLSPQPKFLQGDFQSLDLGITFDAVIMMFAVSGYQLTNDEVAASLKTVQKHLRPGGLFIFDVWYGPAVLAIRPSDRIKVIPTQDGQLIRSASSSLDTFHHLVEVCFHLWNIRDNKIEAETEEHHTIRFFFPQELTYFIRQAGLELVTLKAFPSLDNDLSEETWNALCICRK